MKKTNNVWIIFNNDENINVKIYDENNSYYEIDTYETDIKYFYKYIS